jgi:hypothetical protein
MMSNILAQSKGTSSGPLGHLLQRRRVKFEGGARLHPSPLEKVAEGRMRSLGLSLKREIHQ